MSRCRVCGDDFGPYRLPDIAIGTEVGFRQRQLFRVCGPDCAHELLDLIEAAKKTTDPQTFLDRELINGNGSEHPDRHWRVVAGEKFDIEYVYKEAGSP